MSRQVERAMLSEAVTKASATESISRKLGDDLIAASREVIAATRDMEASAQRVRHAIKRLEQLVGRP